MNLIFVENKKKYIKKISYEAFSSFLRIFFKQQILEPKNLKSDERKKTKIWRAISDISQDLTTGYETQNLELILSAMKKIDSLEKNVFSEDERHE